MLSHQVPHRTKKSSVFFGNTAENEALSDLAGWVAQNKEDQTRPLQIFLKGSFRHMFESRDDRVIYSIFRNFSKNDRFGDLFCFSLGNFCLQLLPAEDQFTNPQT